jgi:anti-sigma regulatory factor (Ser/Thr protein kinase)
MSGDFYGLEQLDIHRLALWVGDVSAKGVPAGLLMVLLNASLRAELYGNFVPGNVLSQLSLNISNVLSEAEQFSTLFLGILDTSNGLLTYSDAGHGHALIFRAATRKIEKLSVTVLPLGIESQLMAVQKEVELNRSDILLVYSDGVTEAASPSGELFGEQRLYEIIRESGAGTVPALRDAIQAAVAQFSQGHILEDDLTLLIIQQEDTRGSGAPKDKPYNAQDPLREWRQLLTSHTGILVPLHEWVAGICSEINLHENPDEFVNACQLGISELVTNVIKHAYRNEHGRITIKALEYHDRLEFIIQDQGLPFKTRSVEGENLPALREGSFGLQITKMVMDEVVYTRTPDDQNIWRLVKRYSGAE